MGLSERERGRIRGNGRLGDDRIPLPATRTSALSGRCRNLSVSGLPELDLLFATGAMQPLRAWHRERMRHVLSRQDPEDGAPICRRTVIEPGYGWSLTLDVEAFDGAGWPCRARLTITHSGRPVRTLAISFCGLAEVAELRSGNIEEGLRRRSAPRA